MSAIRLIKIHDHVQKETPVDADELLISDSEDSWVKKKIAISDLPSGGGTKEYASFYLSTGGLTNVSSTAVTLVVNQTSVNSNGSVFSLSGNEVTVNKTGDFKISAECYFNNSSTTRTEYTMWLEKDTVEVAGTRAATYQRGYDSGDTAAMSIIVSVTSGDVFRLRIQRTDGSATTGYQDDNGTRFTFEEK